MPNFPLIKLKNTHSEIRIKIFQTPFWIIQLCLVYDLQLCDWSQKSNYPHGKRKLLERRHSGTRKPIVNLHKVQTKCLLFR